MGFLGQTEPEKELYSAYGMTVYGETELYGWTIYDNKPNERIF